MVKVEIQAEEVQAFDVLLNETKVKPMVGYKLINFRFRVQQEMGKKQKEVIGNRAEEIVNSKKKAKAKK